MRVKYMHVAHGASKAAFLLFGLALVLVQGSVVEEQPNWLTVCRVMQGRVIANMPNLIVGRIRVFPCFPAVAHRHDEGIIFALPARNVFLGYECCEGSARGCINEGCFVSFLSPWQRPSLLAAWAPKASPCRNQIS